MTGVWHVAIPDEAHMRLLAEICATKAKRGDMITLQGDLGAGKTTFARYLIRAMLGDEFAEVPSPTFTLVQGYDTPRFTVRHFDLYRINGPDELYELEFDDAEGEALTLVEWPERAEGQLGACRLDFVISDDKAASAPGSQEARQVTITATPSARWRLGRIQAAFEFCLEAFDTETRERLRISYLQGDASTRGYARITSSGQSQLLMDMPRMPDGPVIQDGKTYSEIAHLAEDARPFVVIAGALRDAGVSAPEIQAFDEARGMALIEDLGAMTFAEAMAQGVAQEELWRAAVAVLVHLRRFPPAHVIRQGDLEHQMPKFDTGVIRAELELLCEWYWPHAKGRKIEPRERNDFEAAWAPLIATVATRTGNKETGAWLLRDFHSPNLLWLPERSGIARVGVIDFQDAQIGHAAYDLVSLSLDARLDVPRSLHEALIDDYCRQAGMLDPGFDEAEFRLATAILGTQRNTKILGIFARLAMRDGKPEYLRHIPRIKQYLSWCLEHDALAELRMWYDQALSR